MVGRIDVLMATYNGERFVGEQLLSVLAQDHPALRVLVSDDCSSDGTLSVVRRLAAADPRVGVVSEGVRHGGACANFMSLLAASEAPYVAFCDQDDVWLPNRLSACLGEMRRVEGQLPAGAPVAVFSDLAVVDEGLGVVSPSFEAYSGLDPSRTGLRQIVVQNVAAGCSMLLNRPLARLCLRGAGDPRVVMHDWWAMLVASALGGVGHVAEPLVLYRQHGGNELGARRLSPARAAGDVGGLADAHVRRARQAEAFLEAYGGILGGGQVASLRDLVASCGRRTVWGGRPPREERLLEGRPQGARPGRGAGGARPPQPRVWAAVVTFRPELERLRENLAAVAPQVEGVVVFDNGSPDPGRVAAVARGACARAAVVPNGGNAGLAVALNRAVALAASRGATHVLLLDQDSVAGEGMVAALLGRAGPGVAVCCPRVVDRNAGAPRGAGLAAGDVRRAITSGSLLSVDAWSDVGGYDERLFVDWVDFEMCDALRARGWRVVREPGAELLHEMGRQTPAPGLPGVRRGLWRQNYPAWRWRDRARGQAIAIRTYAWTRIGAEEAWLFARKTLGRAAVLERHRAENLGAILAGFLEGLRVPGPRRGWSGWA